MSDIKVSYFWSKIFPSMFRSEMTLRVRYAETDRMGYAYYGNYATWFEVGRVEALRALGLNYRELEDEGILLPVIDFHTRYLKPAFYDDELTVTTMIPELPGPRIVFHYEVHNAAGDLLNKAETQLVFLDKATGRPTRPPQAFMERIAGFFEA